MRCELRHLAYPFPLHAYQTHVLHANVNGCPTRPTTCCSRSIDRDRALRACLMPWPEALFLSLRPHSSPKGLIPLFEALRLSLEPDSSA